MENKRNSVFEWHEDFTVNHEVKQAFNENGYIILRKILDNEEATALKETMEKEHEESIKSIRVDPLGRQVTQSIWTTIADDITGAITRSEKIVGTFEELLGGELYMYHTKMCLKEAKTGGGFVWHQDYGYWYANGCLYPYMGTVWFAVDKATKENGCVQLLSGSHQMGRVEHTCVGNQIGADLARVEQIKKVCPLVYGELEAGDAVMFHGNMLHTSAENNSDDRRWGLAITYNRADNNPVYEHPFNSYTPLEKLPNTEIKKCSTTPDVKGKKYHVFNESTEKSFIEHKRLLSDM